MEVFRPYPVLAKLTQALRIVSLSAVSSGVAERVVFVFPVPALPEARFPNTNGTSWPCPASSFVCKRNTDVSMNLSTTKKKRTALLRGVPYSLPPRSLLSSSVMSIGLQETHWLSFPHTVPQDINPLFSPQRNNPFFVRTRKANLFSNSRHPPTENTLHTNRAMTSSGKE